MSLSITASIRVASLLAAQNPQGAALTSRLVILLGFTLSVSYAYITYQLRDYIGVLFTLDSVTRHRVALLAPAVALFQLSNSLQACCQGILRGCGEQGAVVFFNFMSMWVCGFPAGIAMAFYVPPTSGINGLWYGLALGAGMQTVVLVAMVLSLDWRTEVRKARLRIQSRTSTNDDGVSILESRNSNNSNRDSTMRDSTPSTDEDDMLFGIPRPGSRAVGGMLFFSKSGDEELDDLERIEISSFYDPRSSNL